MIRMDKIKKIFNYFTITEKFIWLGSFLLITILFFIFDSSNLLSYISSIVGITALIFMAKANPIAHILFIVFSAFYAYMSFINAYYGEVFDYIILTIPLSIISLISWFKNLNTKNNILETKISSINIKQTVFISILSITVAIIMYFILKYFGTSNLLISTFSVTTNFFAASLSIKRSHYFALAYAFNDIVLIILWSMQLANDFSYIIMVVYFFITLLNDIYIFISWIRLRDKQKSSPV